MPFEACIARERSTGLLGIDLEKQMQSARFSCKILTRRHAILASDDPNNVLDDRKCLSMAAEKAPFESFKVGLWREQGGNISFGHHQTQFFAGLKERRAPTYPRQSVSFSQSKTQCLKTIHSFRWEPWEFSGWTDRWGPVDHMLSALRVERPARSDVSDWTC